MSASAPPVFDVIVLGAGPSGGAAALEAASLGLRVLLLDENPAAGGQVWRAPAPELTVTPPPAGDEMRQALACSDVDVRPLRRVWSVERHDAGFRVFSDGPGGTERHDAHALIVAAGARERIVPVEGWTLPGVIGLAGATVLLKSQKMLPGRRVVVAGAGPLLALTAILILEGGGEVAAVVDSNGAGAWLSRTPAMMSRPGLAARGAGWLARLAAAGAPILTRSRVMRVLGASAAEGVAVARLDASGRVRSDAGERIIACDAVCLGDGLAPSTEITRLLGCAHAYRPDDGGWTVEADPCGRTDVPGLYVCGDGAGIRGVDAAPLRGRAAARAVAADRRPQDADLRRRLDAAARGAGKAGRFGRAMSALTAPRPQAYADIDPATVVCRCEGVTRARIDAAMTGGALSLNQIKSETRCGMGPCGARFCSDATAALLAAHLGQDMGDIPLSAARPPLRPVALASLAADFDYDALPIPAPAPL